MELLHIDNLSLIINAFINFGLAIFIYSQNRRNPVNISFSFFNLFLTAWSLSILLYSNVNDLHAALYFMKLSYASAILIGVSYYYFSGVFPRQSAEESSEAPPYFNLVLLFALLLIGFTFLPTYLTKSIVLHDWGRETMLGIYEYLAFALFFTLSFIGGLIRSWTKYRVARGQSKAQLLYVVLSVSIAGALGMFFNLLLPSPFLQDFRFIWIGPIFTTLIAISIVYAILAHRLFDIRVIIKRTVIFAGLSAFTLSMYAAIVFLLSGILGLQGEVLNAASMIPNLVAALVIALTFERVQHWLTEATDAWLFKGEYKQEDVIKALSSSLANVINIDEALTQMMNVLVKDIRLERAAVFMLNVDPQKHEYELRGIVKIGEFDESQLVLSPEDTLVRYFEDRGIENEGPVVVDEFERDTANLGANAQAFLNRAKRLSAALVMPLIITRQESVPTPLGQPTKTKDVKTLIGIFILGSKKSGDVFGVTDLNVLQIAASETAAAVEKGRFFEEDRLKTEFVSIVSHELLTPTTSMKGYLSMILDEGIGKVDPTARKYLDKVYAETNRLAVLVKDLLNVSRIERGKILLEPKVTELMPLVTQAVESLEMRAKESSLTLKLEKPKLKVPAVNVDPDKLLEVFINLIGNAVKYTGKGGVTVSVAVDQKTVRVKVVDTGIGIDQKDLQHLFTKFFRASNADQTGQTGTGLGLYLSKHVVELMGGTVEVESVVGKGSTFSVILPVATATKAKA